MAAHLQPAACRPTGRCADREGRAAAVRPAGGCRRRAVPGDAVQRRHLGQQHPPLRRDGARPCRAASADRCLRSDRHRGLQRPGAPGERGAGRGRGRDVQDCRGQRQEAQRLPAHRSAVGQGLPAHRRTLQPRQPQRDHRHCHRFRGPGPDDLRHAARRSDHRGGPPVGGQDGLRAQHWRARGRAREAAGGGLQYGDGRRAAGDASDRLHGAHRPAAPAYRPADRGRLHPADRCHGQDAGCADVHRRDAGAQPLRAAGPCPTPGTPVRPPGAHRHRLPAADDGRQPGRPREPRHRSGRDLACTEVAGQGAEVSRHRAVAALAGGGEAPGQEAHHE